MRRFVPWGLSRLSKMAPHLKGTAAGLVSHLAPMPDWQPRMRRVLLRYAALLALGFAYLVFCRATGLSLPCPFHLVTGLDCPGCGVTRLMLALAAGDLSAAFRANEAIFLLGPFLLFFLLRDDIHWILRGEGKEPPRAFVFFLLVLFVLFTLWRNFLR